VSRSCQSKRAVVLAQGVDALSWLLRLYETRGRGALRWSVFKPARLESSTNSQLPRTLRPRPLCALCSSQSAHVGTYTCCFDHPATSRRPTRPQARLKARRCRLLPSRSIDDSAVSDPPWTSLDAILIPTDRITDHPSSRLDRHRSRFCGFECTLPLTLVTTLAPPMDGRSQTRSSGSSHASPRARR
jgi:hypothetical protein